MALLDDISVSRSMLEDRSNQLADKIVDRGGGRFSWENADKAKSWDGRWLGADRERLRQMDLLTAAVSDPNWTAQIDREAAARKTAGEAQAGSAFRQAEDQRKVAAARGGMAGSSNDAAIEAENRQHVAMVKAQVSQQVDELRSAGIENLENMGRQLLQRALAGPEETAAMGVSQQGAQAGMQTQQLANQNNEMYRGLLANSLTGFLNNTVSPAVQMGFQSADRWNTQLTNDYRDARDTGYRGSFTDYQGASGNGTRDWWGF
jgi:hypothetical protein